LLLPLYPFQLPLGRTPSMSAGEKATAALQKTSCKANDFQATLNLLLSVKADGWKNRSNDLNGSEKGEIKSIHALAHPQGWVPQ